MHFFSYFYVWGGCSDTHSICVRTRGQVSEVTSSPPQCGSWGTKVVRLSSRCFGPLSYLVTYHASEFSITYKLYFLIMPLNSCALFCLHFFGLWVQTLLKYLSSHWFFLNPYQVYLWAQMHFFLFTNWVQVFSLVNFHVAEPILYNLWSFMAFSILKIVFKILWFFFIGATLGPICEDQVFIQTVCSLPLGMLVIFCWKIDMYSE